MSETETMREKIRKLLKIAECESASDAEKATALHQAARLSEKHAIDLDALGRDASEFGTTVLEAFGTRSPSWCNAVGMVLSEHFNVSVYVERISSKRGGRDVRWHCFGCKPSREISVYVWTYLKREFLRAARDLLKRHKKIDRQSLFVSLAFGVISRLNDLKRQLLAEDAQATALIVSSLKAEFATFSAGFGVVKKVKINADREAFNRGKDIEIRTALKTTSVPHRICAKEST